MNIVLEITQIKLGTLLPDGTVLKVWSLPMPIADMKNFIGERKRLSYRLTAKKPDTTPYDLDGATLYFNPALFVNSGYAVNINGKGVNYWSFPLPNVITPGDTFNCNLTMGNSQTVGLIKNYEVSIKAINSNTFTVAIDFFMTYDANGFLDPNFESNLKRFLKDIKTNPDDLVSSDLSTVYKNTDRVVKFYNFVEKGNDSGFKTESVPFAAGFYMEKVSGGPTVYSDLNFVLKRNGNPVTNLSATQDTQVEFFATGGPPITNMLVWLLRVDDDNSQYDFLTNYDADFQEIKAGNMGDYKIIGPMTSPVLIGAQTYKSTFSVKASELVFGQNYRFMGIVYTQDGVSIFDGTTNLGGVTPVDAVPCFDGSGFELEGRLSDYNKQFTGDDLECCIEERMKSILAMDFTSDKWKNYIAAKLGLTVANDVRRYLTQISCTIYQEYTDSSSNVIKNIYKQVFANKLTAVSYSTDPDISVNFPNDGSASFECNWRNRYEAGTNNVQSFINGVNVPPLDNQYWGGKNFTVEWKLTFFYDDYFAPFTDEIIYNQEIRVRDYGGVQLFLQGDDPEAVNVCNGENMCFDALYNRIDPIEDPYVYALIANIEPSPGNITTIEEAEAWVGNELPQLTTPKIYDEEVLYGDTQTDVAKFCVDTTKLTLNLPYKITALAKRFDEGCRRVTEHKDAIAQFDEPRKTEIYDQRVPEECAN